ncbi:hypothetical protein [Mycetohabitans sp. B6]|uniref:hypothetical protein n=1 Tax=Mycetohabitans sp. B6 TaxID=2841843 RepID=UPI001F1B7FEE|nr:hypothetical protein [Mycetohabitans sp. B6]MCG1046579.1 hypothetical protein [Mycetohabitans sp. B6]
MSSLAHERQKTAALARSLAVSQAAFYVYVSASKRTQARAATNRKAINNALNANPDWRDMPIPDSVFNSLYANRPRILSRPASGVTVR